MITLMKGDTVKIVSDPYGGMLGSVVGKTATVTAVKGSVVGLKIKGGPSVKTWMLKDGSGASTLQPVGGKKKLVVGAGPDDVVRVKVIGGTTDTPLYKGMDSKGRTRYELIPPDGQNALQVASELRKAAKAGKKVLGGTVYAIRIFRPGKGEYNYWTKGAAVTTASTNQAAANGVFAKTSNQPKGGIVKKVTFWTHPNFAWKQMKPNIPYADEQILYAAGWNKGKLKNKGAPSCPAATLNLKLNTKNRDHAIKSDYIRYGPLNVDVPGDYWEKIAKKWKTSVSAAKKSLCGNCVAFDVSPRMKKCMPGKTSDSDGVLGYCHMHHFKCHSARTCNTWAMGGPIKTNKVSEGWLLRLAGALL